MAVRPEYLEKGLRGISRAHLVDTMTGHLGATLVAGYLFSEEHRELDRKVHAGIEKELDRVLKGESVFDPGEGGSITTSELFVPYPDEAMQVDQIDRIAQVLSRNIGGTRSMVSTGWLVWLMIQPSCSRPGMRFAISCRRQECRYVLVCSLLGDWNSTAPYTSTHGSGAFAPFR